MMGKRVDATAEDGNQWPFPTLKAGEYGKGTDGRWRCIPPGDWDWGFIGNLDGHTVIEHDDGTITVSPSILIGSGTKQTWHGYLEKGIWREC